MYTFGIDSNRKPSQNLQQYNYIFLTLRGVFLALLVFSASFLAPYMGCNYQLLMKQKRHLRYLFLFLVIYFSINLVDPDLGNKENPFVVVLKSVVVFFIFILLNNINTSSIVLVLILFAILIFTSKYYYYHKETVLNKTQSTQVTEEVLLAIQVSLSVCIFSVILISFFIEDKRKNNYSLEKCII